MLTVPPGYSLVLSKSYVLFTTLVSVLFLHGAIDLRKAVAILLIVGFSAVVMINRTGRAAGTGNQWVWLSFASFFAWGLLSLSSKYLFSHGLGTIPFLVYLYALVSLCILVEARVGKKSLNQGIKVHWLILLAIGIFSTIFNLGQFLAINAAPNIGFVNAINASSISLVTVMSMIFFHDELTVKKSIGIAGVTAGLLLLVV
jgi:drug/metabolite transporter (DMT)-like permease